MPKMIEYMLCLIENTIILMFFNSLMERRFKSGLFIIPIIFINATIVFFCTALNVPLRSIILVVITIIGCCVLYKGAIHIKTSLSLVALFLLNIIDIIFGLFSSIVLSVSVIEVFFGSTIRRVILCLIIKAADALIIFAAHKMFLKSRLAASKKVWMLFCLVMFTFLFVTVIFTELYQSSPENASASTLYFAASIAFFITGMIIIYLFTYVCGSFSNEKRLYVLQSCYDGIKEQLSVQSENSKKVVKIRHDTKNHLRIAKALLSKGQYEAAESLVDEMIEQTDNIRLEFIAATGNDIIDAAIAVKSAVCATRNIDFKLSCEKLPHLNISEIDLSSLISNILDNAITAAEKTNDPRVIMKIFVRGDYLNIVSENTYSGKIEESREGKLTTFLTTKFNSEEHGFGTQIIAEISRKYDGVCVYKYEYGLFKMNIMLNYSDAHAICEQA